MVIRGTDLWYFAQVLPSAKHPNSIPRVTIFLLIAMDSVSPMTEKQNIQQINLFAQTPAMVDQRTAPVCHLQWNNIHVHGPGTRHINFRDLPPPTQAVSRQWQMALFCNIICTSQHRNLRESYTIPGIYPITEILIRHF